MKRILLVELLLVLITIADIEEDNPHQQWIWHTGEDIITAVKSQDKPFILFYRPSLLDPTFL